MPAPHERTFRVFYSWQSDLPDLDNLKLIRNALSQAATAMNSDHAMNLHVVVDEATRDVPGSPDIKDSIFKKIREADAFVCDLTKVAEFTNGAGEVRKYCNSNVAIELGYAIRVLGWNRIIIVFNQAYGAVPADLPFDVHGHRCSSYRCNVELDDQGRPTAACKSAISNATGALRITLVEATTLILTDNPKRPLELEAKSAEQIRRERDVIQLQNVFRWINLKMMDRFIDAVADGRVLYEGEAMRDGLLKVLNESEFHIDDEELHKLIQEFTTAWVGCFKYCGQMDPLPNGKGGFFKPPSDVATLLEQSASFTYTCNQARPLRDKLDELLSYVRENYLEIDPVHAGEAEVKKYWENEEGLNEKSKPQLSK